MWNGIIREEKSAWLCALLKKNPESMIKIFLRCLVWQRLRESDDRQFDEVSSEIELLLAEGTEFSEPSLCAVAALGNFEVMQQLLSKGVDVDKTDYSGRTALVCPTLHYGHSITCLALVLDALI